MLAWGVSGDLLITQKGVQEAISVVNVHVLHITETSCDKFTKWDVLLKLG